MDAACQKTNDIARGRRSRVVLTPRRWRQVGEGDFIGDGGKKARSPAIECTHLFWLPSLVETDSLLGVDLAEGGVMSMEVGLGRFGDRRLEKGGRRCMRLSFDGLVRVSDALPGTGRRRFGSRVFCAMKG